MSTTPEFKFTKKSVNITEEEFQKELEKPERGSFLGVGVHTVEITEAEFHKSKRTDSIWSDKDPTWFLVRFKFTAGDRSKDYYQLVPTKKIKFNEENSKAPLFVFFKFRQFMAAIGEEIGADAAELQDVIPKYFSDPSVMVGKRVKIEIKYSGMYAKKVGGEYKIVNADGSDHEVFTDLFESKDKAEIAAAKAGIRLQKGPEIASVSAIEKVKKSETKVEETEEVDDDWE